MTDDGARGVAERDVSCPRTATPPATGRHGCTRPDGSGTAKQSAHGTCGKPSPTRSKV